MQPYLTLLQRFGIERDRFNTMKEPLISPWSDRDAYRGLPHSTQHWKDPTLLKTYRGFSNREQSRTVITSPTTLLDSDKSNWSTGEEMPPEDDSRLITNQDEIGFCRVSDVSLRNPPRDMNREFANPDSFLAGWSVSRSVANL